MLEDLRATPLEDKEKTDDILGKISKIDEIIANNKKASLAEVNVEWQVVRNGRIFKKVQVITLMQDNFAMQKEGMQKAVNDMNELIRKLSITEAWDMTWKVNYPTIYKRDTGLYEIL